MATLSGSCKYYTATFQNPNCGTLVWTPILDSNTYHFYAMHHIRGHRADTTRITHGFIKGPIRKLSDTWSRLGCFAKFWGQLYLGLFWEPLFVKLPFRYFRAPPAWEQTLATMASHAGPSQSAAKAGNPCSPKTHAENLSRLLFPKGA